MDATDKQQYRRHLVMNSARYGREPIMWIVRLPESCSLDRLELAWELTPIEIETLAEGVAGQVLPQWVARDQSRFLRHGH